MEIIGQVFLFISIIVTGITSASFVLVNFEGLVFCPYCILMSVLTTETFKVDIFIGL